MSTPTVAPAPAPSRVQRNPIGTHVLVGKGLVAGALTDARRLGCETLQVFVGNPRGWALSPGRPAEDEAFRVAAAEHGVRTFIHAPHLCHVFAAGAPLDEPGGTTATVDRVVESAGPGRLRLVHANDSMDVRGAMKDRHERIGRGHIGTGAFSELFVHPALAGVPLILETPGSRESGGDVEVLQGLRERAPEQATGRAAGR